MVRQPLRPGGAAPGNAATARALALDEISPTLKRQWVELADHALEPNVFLSPVFVLRAARHLTPRARPLVLAITAPRPGGRLIGLSVFRHCARTRRFPLPHLVGYRSRHTYLGGMLLEARRPDIAADALFAFLASSDNHWHGVAFEELDARGAMGYALRDAAVRRGATWTEFDRMRRAFLDPVELADEPHALLSRRRRRDLERRERRLAELGRVSWRLLVGRDVDRDVVDRFIALEHRGWKGQRGSSLQARPDDRRFFEEVSVRLRERGQVFFTELAVDGRVIASTSNFLAGGAGFAFKIGWDDAYRKYAPGLLSEYLLLREGGDFLRRLRFFDSGAEEGSYLEALWPGRRELSAGAFATSAAARTALAGVRVARGMRQRIRGRSGN